MISSLLIINTINKIFGKQGAETTTLQECHNLSGRHLLRGKPGITIYARYSNRKENLLKEEFWIPNHKHVALYGFVFFSVACSWNNRATCLGCAAEARGSHSCRLGTPCWVRGSGMLRLSLLPPCCKEPALRAGEGKNTQCHYSKARCLGFKHAYRELESKLQLLSGSSTELAPGSKIAASS